MSNRILANLEKTVSTNNDSNWYGNVQCKIHFDMHTPDTVEHVGRDFDPESFAAAMAEIGAEAVCFFARCTYGWSYYPTKVGFPHPHLEKDIFGDGVRALKKKGIKVIAYLAICSLPVAKTEECQDWVIRQEDGSIPSHTKVSSVVSVCTSRYLDEHLIPQIVEIVNEYDVDGFFLDGVYEYYRHPCYCEACKDSFGKPIPIDPDDPTWHIWHYWRRKLIDSALSAAAEKATSIRPGCLLGVNWLGDIRYSVPPPVGIGYLTGDPPMLNCTFETSYRLAAWAWRDLPADVMNQRMLINWQDFTCRTPESIKTDFAAGIAGSGKLFIGDLLTPVGVRSDPEVLNVIKSAFDFAKERNSVAGAGKQKCDIAILSSSEALRVIPQQPQVNEAPIRGTLLAIMEHGLAADILYDEDLNDELSRYQTLVVPEQQYIQGAAETAIKTFVENGGSLVVTGHLPMLAEPGRPALGEDRNFFERLAGVHYHGSHGAALSYLCLKDTAAESLWRKAETFRPPVPVPGHSSKVMAQGASVLAKVTAPDSEYQVGALPPGQETEYPAITEHGFGTGKVIFCALSLAADIWQRGNPGATYILQGLIRRATPESSFFRSGPSCVHIRRADSDDKTILHLVAFQPDRGIDGPRIIDNPAEIHGVSVALRQRDGRRDPASVVVEPQGVEATVKKEGDLLTAEVPPFKIHCAVVFEWD